MAERESTTRDDGIVDLTDGRRASRAAHPSERGTSPPPAGLDDLVHPHDAERLVALIRQASSRRQDTFVRVRHAELGWIEVRCSFVPVDPTEAHDS